MEAKASQKINPTCKHIIINPQNKSPTQHQKLPKKVTNIFIHLQKKQKYTTHKNKIEVEKKSNNKESEK